MRSILITAGVFLLLVVAFIVFVLTQKGGAPLVKKRAPSSTMPVLREGSGGGVGPGEGGWVKSYDPKNGQLINEFRADTFDQPVNDKIHVVRPEARFYSDDGTVLNLKAATGDVTLAQAARRGKGFGSMQGRPPRDGTLYDVELNFFEHDADPLPVLTCYLPVVYFDNDLLRLDTVAMTDRNGRKLAGDQVPVTVRGRDYDFDGEGLTVRYNQRDRRLERLEIAHGKRLTVKNAKAFGDTPGGPLGVVRPAALDRTYTSAIEPNKATGPRLTDATARAVDSLSAERFSPVGSTARAVASHHEASRDTLTDALGSSLRDRSPDTPVVLTDVTGRPIELVSADPVAGPQMTRQERELRRQKREAATRRADREARDAKRRNATRPSTRRATTRPREVVAYTASFQSDVTVREAGTQVGQAERMDVTFTFDKNAPATRQATALPSDGVDSATRPARRAAVSSPTPVPGVQPATRRSRRATPTTQRAATVPATRPAGPVEIRWTGKLVVTPQKLATSGLKSPADRIVAFAGKPVRLARDGATITAASVWAATEGQRFNASADPATPRVTVTDARGTTIVTENISADGNDANLTGRSSAEVVIDGDGGRPAQTLRATWTDFAAIRTAAGAGGQRGIERAVFRGAVDVKHEKLDLNSDTLALGFAPAQQADRPQLSGVRADGHVRAAVRDSAGRAQTIAADTLDLGLSQKPGNEIAVDTLHANGGVVASDGRQTLRTDDLKTTLSAGREPAPAKTTPSLAVDTLAATGRVDIRTENGQTVTADRLTVEKLNGLQWVTLYGQDAVITDGASRVSGKKISIDAAGTRASIDGPGRLGGASKPTGGKAAQPVDVKWTEGMQYDAASDSARVLGNVVVHTVGSDRTDNSATGKTLEITFAAAPATRPSGKDAATRPFGVGGDKQIQSLTLSGDGAPDAVKVASYLYDAADPAKLLRRTALHAPTLKVMVNADGSPGAMDVPAGGRVLYEELPGARPANAVPGAPAPGDAVGAFARGTVALKWTRLMHYDPAAKQVTLDGDVAVVHQDVKGQRVSLAAPKLTADISGGVTPQGIQLKRVVATGGTTLSGQNMTIVADHAEFDPAADLVKAFGTPRQPVQWFEQDGVSRGSFAEVWWNLKDNRPEKLKDVTVEMNR